MNYKEIGKYLRTKREDKNISIDELSEKINVPVKKIKSWEKGRTIQ